MAEAGRVKKLLNKIKRIARKRGTSIIMFELDDRGGTQTFSCGCSKEVEVLSSIEVVELAKLLEPKQSSPKFERKVFDILFGPPQQVFRHLFFKTKIKGTVFHYIWNMSRLDEMYGGTAFLISFNLSPETIEKSIDSLQAC